MTERDYELLSAYLDDLLDADERAALEARLLTDAVLRRELAALRQTVALVNGLPTLKAPRDFTLRPEQADVREVTRSRRAASRFTPLIPVLAAVAVVTVMFVGVLALLSLMQPAVGDIFSEVAYSEDGGRRIVNTPTVALPPAAQGAGGLDRADLEDPEAIEDAVADAFLFETFEAAPEDTDAHGEDEALLQEVMPAMATPALMMTAAGEAAEAALSAMMAPDTPEADAVPPSALSDLRFDPSVLLPLLRLLLWLAGG